MLVAVTSPDGGVRVTIGGPGQIDLAFVGSAFRRYDEETLRYQLERMGALAWVAYDRAHTEQHRRDLGYASDEYAEQQRRPVDERRQHYDADLAVLESEGVSPGGWLRIRARGLLRWQVLMEPGTLRRLSEDDFLREAHGALRALFADRDVRITIVKARYYDLGVPRAWRHLLVDPERAEPSRR